MAGTEISLGIDQQVDVLRQHVGDFADEIAAKEAGHGATARRAEDEARGA
jgi:hypothetical protein